MSTRKLTIAGLFVALGLIMPFLTGQIPSLGNKLLPMHIPILLCGFILGWPYGLIVGLIVPVFRSILFGMPPMFPVAIAMSLELATYGFVTGFLYDLTSKKNLNVYVTLIVAMICGRIAWGIISVILYGISGVTFSWKIFVTGALINAIPGIIIQIILIPILIIALNKARLIHNV